jgi:hypothetical protein
MLRDPGSALYHDMQLIEWIARDEREAMEDDLANSGFHDENLRLAQSIQGFVAASRCRLKRIRGGPEYETPGFLGSAPTVLQDANLAGSAPCLDLSVAAGLGRQLWDEDCASWVKLPADMPKSSYVALKVSGESMAPLLHQGDVIIVRLDSPFSSGDVVVARLEDDGFVVKRAGRVTAASVELRSVNPAYPSVQVARAAETIVGVVVLCWCEH